MGDAAVVKIFDTTLRDGEQSPGATMALDEKLQVAQQLTRLKVDCIEAGFPAASPGDLSAVKAIARHTRGAAVVALARARLSDIDAAWEGVREAEQPVIHVFLATSEIHLTQKLKLSREEALQCIKSAVTHARHLCPTVEFSAEDATRSDWDYLCTVFATAIKAGATTINVPDTVGYAMPGEYEMLFRYLREHIPGSGDVIWSAHCHDDLGLATANALAAVRAGARQVEVTVNGIGERAGNTALEEVVMALRTRPETFHNVDMHIDAEQLVATSQMVSRITGLPVQPNKAIVGRNAFAHEAGVHQDGMLKNRQTYEIMTPQSVGWTETKFVLGKHSGRHALDARLRQLGYKLSTQELKTIYDRFVVMADEKKDVTDADLIFIIESGKETPAAI
ncbi:MAG TPA: 2-isopropylmalate synthase [Ktedonobacteraceae bacterium]|jgi:2-isopropylmalate synthase|nr:2-isopropylmalate synthase [Ktedonobacteraceae bacterium]